MGQELGLQLREDSLMTKVMLRKQQEVIDHIQQEKIEVNRPINQMGDTMLHYAAYKGLQELMEYLLQHEADPYQPNNVQTIKTKRALAAVDVALPPTREWLIKRYQCILNQKANQGASQPIKRATTQGGVSEDPKRKATA